MSIQPASLAEFKSSASPGHYHPFLKRLDIFGDPLEIYGIFREKSSPSVLLESARLSGKTGRYSFIAKDPFLIFQADHSKITLSSFGQTESLEGDPFQALSCILDAFYSEAVPGFPPFTGGAVGYFGYEAKNYLEPTLPRSAKERVELPDIYLMFFDEGIAIDHETRAIYLFVNQKTGKDLSKGYQAGLKRLSRLEKDFKARYSGKARLSRGRTEERLERFSFGGRVKERGFFPESSLSREEFVKKVNQIKRYIREGEIFQANLSQRFSFPLEKDTLEVYRSLRTVNPSPFFGFLDAVDFQILSGSPERLLKLENGLLETRPIAGTRARGKNEAEDSALSKELFLSPKERAEHIMLVDLERNDLGRVAEYGSVSVDEMMTLENYSHVKHIVSNIKAVLRKGLTALDAFRAFFPGGTITGTPKIRCMEILDALETVERGPYTGSLGYFSASGNMDFNIIIRSLMIKDGMAYLHAGAGIVADSVPQKEYEETLYKAEGLLTALFGKEETGVFLAKCGVTDRVS